jgi:hypothetical protein
MKNVRIFWEMVCRMAWWAWKMRKNHDWDFAYLYLTIHLKLKRMDDNMLTGKSYASWTYNKQSRCYRSLKEAKELAKRLADGEEDMKIIMQFHDRFGFRSDFARRIGIEKENAEPISDKLYDRLYRKAVKENKEHYKAVKRRFYYLLETFGDHWWD